jgi:hypothetical protein
MLSVDHHRPADEGVWRKFRRFIECPVYAGLRMLGMRELLPIHNVTVQKRDSAEIAA